jgi:hypothetical protein
MRGTFDLTGARREHQPERACAECDQLLVQVVENGLELAIEPLGLASSL